MKIKITTEFEITDPCLGNEAEAQQNIYDIVGNGIVSSSAKCIEIAGMVDTEIKEAVLKAARFEFDVWRKIMKNLRVEVKD